MAYCETPPGQVKGQMCNICIAERPPWYLIFASISPHEPLRVRLGSGAPGGGTTALAPEACRRVALEVGPEACPARRDGEAWVRVLPTCMDSDSDGVLK